MTNLNFDIFGRDHGLGAILEKLNRDVTSLENNLKELDRTDANPSIRLEQVAEARRQLKELQNDLRQLNNVKLRIDADTAKARADINAAQRDLDELYARAAQGENVDLEIAQAKARIDELKVHLATLKDAKINADADTAAAKAKFAELETIVKGIGDVHINADADVGAATAKMTALAVASRSAANAGNPVTRTLRDISAAVGPVVSGIGNAVTSFGNFVSSIGGGIGIISGIGSAISSIGSSLTSAGEGFTQFGSAASGALGSLASSAASIGLVVVQLSALAGAGALVVGALGQIGGAAIALGSGIVPLVQSLGLLPGLVLPLVVGFGALAIGFSNTGKSGIEFKNTMDQLKTAFTPVIDSIRSQMQPAIQNLLNSFKSLAPAIQAVVPQITSAVSDVANSFAQLFSSSSFQKDFQQILVSAANNFRTFGDIGKNALQGIMNVMISAQPAVDRFVQFLDQGVQKWNAWTAAARQSGELTTIFNQAEQALEQIIGTIGNLAGLFVDLWNSANRTGAFQSTLQAINQGITQFRDYVNQAGGAWDQLMSKAGSVTQSLVGLVGSIGQAFVQLGSQIDISSSIDAISQAIQRVTPAFTQIGQQANTVFQEIITIAGRAAEALGPAIAQSLNAIGTAIKGIDWESVVTGVAGAIQAFTNLTNALTTVGQMFTTFEQLIMQVNNLDFAGASASLDKLDQLWEQLKQDLTNTQGIDAAKQSVQGLNQEVQNIKQPPPITFTANADQVTAAANLAETGVMRVPTSWMSQFIGDVSNISQGVQQAIAGVNSVPQTHNTTLTADGAALIAAAAQGTQAIQGVVPNWLTKFAGDSASLVASAQQADQQVQSIPVEKKVMITGDASSATSATSQATGALNTIPPTKAVAITATDQASAVAQVATNAVNAVPAVKTITITATDQVSAVAQAAANAINAVPPTKASTITATDQASASAQAATNAINAVPDTKAVTISITDQATSVVQSITNAINGVPDHTSTINVNDQASGVIQNIANQINSLQNRTITITTVYQTVGAPPGQAAGSILEPMAGGGISYGRSFGNLLPMARGGTVRRLTQMSGSSASIVQPNTWRIVGDRPSGAEAFIPINHSGRSVAILGETAGRMGFALVPMMHSGGGSWRDRRSWDWLEELLRRYRRHPGGGGVPVPTTIGTSSLQRVMSSVAFGGSGGMASYMRNVLAPQTQVIAPATSPPQGGVVGRDSYGAKTIYIDSNSAFMQEVLRYIRAEIRKQGGDVQVALGR